MTADDEYPFGVLRVHPARENGIDVTFSHQMANDGGDHDVPWRPGYLCLQRPEQTLAIAQEAPEPIEGDARMVWALERTVAWVNQALAGELRRDGDAYELPQVQSTHAETIITREGPDTFAALDGVPGGRATLRRWNGARHAVIGEFRDGRGRAVRELRRLRAGVGRATVSDAAWVMLPQAPLVPPWGMPQTWATLTDPAVCGVDNLVDLIHAVRSGNKPNRINTLLLGFPVPERVGEPATQIRWLAAKLPVLPPKGWRDASWNIYMSARAETASRIEWIAVENWSDRQLFGRGRLNSEHLQNEPIVVIGAGAIGSHLAFLLAKGGCSDLTIIDGDTLEVGNLTRHLLGIDSIGRNKANALAAHLRLATATITVIAVPKYLRSLDAEAGEAIARARVVIDCTAGDIVPAVLSQLEDNRRRWFYSLMLGWEAKRMHVFSVRDIRLDQGYYVNETAAVAELERSERIERGESAVDPDVGCWHPMFPAAGADVAALVARAVRLIDDGTSSSPKIRTIRQQVDNERAEVRT